MRRKTQDASLKPNLSGIGRSKTAVDDGYDSGDMRGGNPGAQKNNNNIDTSTNTPRRPLAQRSMTGPTRYNYTNASGDRGSSRYFSPLPEFTMPFESNPSSRRRDRRSLEQDVSAPPSAAPSDDEEEPIVVTSSVGGGSGQQKNKKKTLHGRMKTAFSHMHLPVLSRSPSLSRPPSLDNRTYNYSQHQHQEPQMAQSQSHASHRMHFDEDHPLFQLRRENDLESRRPSYASNQTVSSNNSRLSRNINDNSDADDEAELSGTLSPNEPNPLAMSQSSAYSNRGDFFVNSRPNPTYLPEPEQIQSHLDPIGMRLLEQYDQQGTQSTPGSRSGSIASGASGLSDQAIGGSLALGKAKKSKRGFFGKLRAKGGSAGGTEEEIQPRSRKASKSSSSTSGEQQQQLHNRSLKPRYSSASLRNPIHDPFYSREELGGVSQQNSPKLEPTSTGPYANERTKNLSKLRRTASQSSLLKGMGITSSSSRQPLPQAAHHHHLHHGLFTKRGGTNEEPVRLPSTAGGEDLRHADEAAPVGGVHLDTNLREMSGIVKEGAPGPAPLKVEEESSWKAPESWGVNTSYTPTTEDALWGAMDSSTLAEEGKKNYFLRVYRDDDTFGTVSCPLEITVAELLQILGKKFFLDSVAGYDLTVRSGGLTRVLQKKERPLMLQRALLQFIGYTERDRYQDLGREDLGYLCRFVFSKSPLKSFPTDDALSTRDFRTVFLRNRSLQTIPIVFHQHAEEVEFLDVSENPAIVVPLDFIQSCVNLRAIRFINNHCIQFPHNINRASTLVSLDLSNNLLVTLDNLDFTELRNLKSLNLQGNRINELPNELCQLNNLRLLNMSSNNLSDINLSVCSIKTLVSLDLSFNQIQRLPKEIGDLTSLEKLGMTNNNLSGFPPEFVKLRSLTELDVRFNNIHKIDVLSQLANLTSLYCSKNNVSACDMTFQRLNLLHLDRNPITQISFREPLTSLAVLDLGKAKLTDLSESLVEQIPMVERLVLNGNHLVHLPANIGSLRRLLYLNVSNNQLSVLPDGIDQLQELRTLDLHSNNLKSLPQEIWNLSSLLELNVSSNLLQAFPKSKPHGSSVGSADMAHKYPGGTGLATSGSSQGGTSSPLPALTAPPAFSGEFDFVRDKNWNDRRPSARSESSSMPSPREGMSRRGSEYPVPPQATGSAANFELVPIMDSDTGGPYSNLRQSSPPLSLCLTTLRAADNRLTEDCLWEISGLFQLQMLNLSYNELMDIPAGTLVRLQRLRELYLSGNNLTSLPPDDLEKLQALKVFYVNLNKLHSLPAEVGKIAHLQVFDVGSNSLRYNINNWPYDWNWHYNPELKYLNFSGNRRLEIKSQHGPGTFTRGPGEQPNLSDFTVLNKLRVLGLMDVTLMTPSVPDQTENCRVRTYGSYVLSMGYGMADSLGATENLSVMDLVLEKFRGNDKEAIIGLFDGRTSFNRSSSTPSGRACDAGGNKVCALVQETFVGIFYQELEKLRKGETVQDALRRAFLSTNKEIGNTTMLGREEIARTYLGHRSSTAANLTESDRSTGSCATVVYINDSKMYVANVGDTMAVLSRGNGEYKVVTQKHDPTSAEELARIRGGAGLISNNGLLDDVLDVSRIIGFYNLIPHVFAAPSISEHDLTDADDFLIIASKQLWEYMSFEDAVDLARTEINDPMTAAQKLRDFAIGYGCTEKIMVMVIGVGGFRRKSSARQNKGLAQVGGPLSVGTGEEDILLNSSLFKKRRDKSLLPEDSALARLGGEVDPPVGDVAMVFTDIKNSTVLWENYPIAMRSAIKLHNAVMRRNIRIMGGYEVKTEGDAFIVSFPTPTSALLWCFNVQQQLIDADWPAEILESEEAGLITDDNGKILFRGLSVRMGIHWGIPVFETDVITKRMDYFGPMVNRTARISAVADGGQITVSSDFLAEIRRLDQSHEAVVQHRKSIQEAYGDETMGNILDRDMKILKVTGYAIQDLGEMKLKGLENPEMITVIYPGGLDGRMKYHEENRTSDQISQQAHHFQTSQQTEMRKRKRPSHPLGAGARRVGGLTMDILSQLRFISNRLEKVCSMLNMGMPDTGGFADFNRKTANSVGIVIPPTDYDYTLFFDQLITRIENALATLYLRAISSAISDDARAATVAELSKLLSTLLDVDNIAKNNNNNGESGEAEMDEEKMRVDDGNNNKIKTNDTDVVTNDDTYINNNNTNEITNNNNNNNNNSNNDNNNNEH